MRFLVVLCAVALLSLGAVAQTPTQDPAATPQSQPPTQTTPATQQSPEPELADRPQTEPAQPHQVAPGTEIRASLNSALSSKTSEQGDEFTATITDDVRAGNGSVAIPAGSVIQGRVATVEEGKTLPAIRGGARLNLRFQEVVLTDGRRAPIQATLVSLHDTKGADRAQTDEEGEVSGRTRGEDVARDVGIGAAAGTVIGLVFGKALRGLAIGAAAGGGYVLATRGRDVELPANTGMLLRLDQTLSPPTR